MSLTPAPDILSQKYRGEQKNTVCNWIILNLSSHQIKLETRLQILCDQGRGHQTKSNSGRLLETKAAWTWWPDKSKSRHDSAKQN